MMRLNDCETAFGLSHQRSSIKNSIYRILNNSDFSYSVVQTKNKTISNFTTLCSNSAISSSVEVPCYMRKIMTKKPIEGKTSFFDHCSD